MPESRVRLGVEAVGQAEPVAIELEPGKGALIGRLPDPRTVAGDKPVASYVIALPSVSANHALVWVDDTGLHVRDLGSRNGTWVRVPSNQTAHLPAGDTQLRLSAASGERQAEDLPEPVAYKTSADYGDGIARAIRQWCERHQLHVTVRLERGDPARVAANGFSVRLATGDHILVAAEGTVDDRFSHRLAQISRYVADQNALYLAEYEARRDGMILASPQIRDVYRQVVQAASSGRKGLVLLGPSGTGKERLARTFHHHTGRGGALVTINCGALVDRDRSVADLFGAEMGSYTGAHKLMIGAVERADGGTLFLDEVGELPLDIQPQLLRFIDTGEYHRLGALGDPHTADVRVIAATNRDLKRMVADGTFRRDLYFRLAFDVIDVPPLDKRFADITAYLDTQVLAGCSALEALAPEALELLRRHPWSGNFRELVNFAQRLPRSATPGSLGPAAIEPLLQSGVIEPVRDSGSIPTEGGWAELVQACLAAWLTDGNPEPTTWSDVVNFIEQYFKPHALAHIADIGDATDLDSVAPSRIAQRIDADRGTVIKQLRRFFDLPRTQ